MRRKIAAASLVSLIAFLAGSAAPAAQGELENLTFLFLMPWLGLASEDLPAGFPGIPRGLELRIVLHGQAAGRADGSYVVGEPIFIKCVFANQGTEPLTLLLKDHDDYHIAWAFPAWVAAKVEDSAGKILTSPNGEEDGFWSAHFLSSTMMQVAPDDLVSLKPGEEVTKIIPLEKVLAGSPAQTLAAGRYVVQLSYGDVLSNELAVVLVPE